MPWPSVPANPTSLDHPVVVWLSVNTTRDVRSASNQENQISSDKYQDVLNMMKFELPKYCLILNASSWSKKSAWLEFPKKGNFPECGSTESSSRYHIPYQLVRNGSFITYSQQSYGNHVLVTVSSLKKGCRYLIEWWAYQQHRRPLFFSRPYYLVSQKPTARKSSTNYRSTHTPIKYTPTPVLTPLSIKFQPTLMVLC